ncbi:LysR family transcriptional regulator, partial [Burkholderia cenocepacia]|nr:LysR family transcriptional regulator [Burkholderia cenocepacia]
ALRGVDTTIDEYVYYLKARRQSPAIDAFLACILPGDGEAADAIDAADTVETGRTMRRVNAR